MSKKEKLLKRFLRCPNDFHFDELETLLRYFGYFKIKSGKTSGSRMKFKNSDNVRITLHKPHPRGLLKSYQLRQIKELLDL